MSDFSFEKLLQETNQAYREAKEFSDWSPPDGDYTVVIKKTEKGVTVKDEKPMLWWKHTAEILAGGDDPALMGREFTSGFWTSKNYGQAKGQAKVLNGGIAPEGTEALNAVLDGATGTVLRVQVKTTTSRKNGKDYTNTYYQEVIDATATGEQTGMDATSPQ